MEDLYIVEQGCIIKKKGERFAVYKNNVKLSEIPMFKVNTIMLLGNQNITSQAIETAFENNIDILFLSRSGQLKGKLSGIKSKNIFLRLIQYDILKSPERKLNIAKCIVKGKAKNQILFLKRHSIKSENIDNMFIKVDNAENTNELMGIEGNISKIYFSKLKETLPENFVFEGRNRRPPKDEVNALLSFTYTMTLNKITSDIDASGLDSYIGYLHSIKYGRESLPLDILEEFRQSFCDPFVVKLLNRKEIRKEHFIKQGESVILTDTALRIYLNKFNDASQNLNENIKQQIQLFKNALIENKDYEPIKYKW